MSGHISGFSIPFRVDEASGSIAVQKDEDEKLKENLIHIVLTGVGERVMRRKYGGGMKQLLHDPNNDAMRAIVQHQLSKAIIENEPRIILQGIDILQRDAMLIAEIRYAVKRSQQSQNLSVPLGLGGI